MKFKKLETASCHNQHERFVLHVGREEVKILISLLDKARICMPKTEGTTPTLNSMKQMLREFRKLVVKHDGV